MSMRSDVRQDFSLSLEFGHFSPRSGRECVAQGKSAQPWVSMRLLTMSPRSGRQKKLQIRDVRAAAAARCAGLAANVPTFPGLRRLALGYTLSPATRVPPTRWRTNDDSIARPALRNS